MKSPRGAFRRRCSRHTIWYQYYWYADTPASTHQLASPDDEPEVLQDDPSPRLAVAWSVDMPQSAVESAMIELGDWLIAAASAIDVAGAIFLFLFFLLTSLGMMARTCEYLKKAGRCLTPEQQRSSISYLGAFSLKLKAHASTLQFSSSEWSESLHGRNKARR